MDIPVPAQSPVSADVVNKGTAKIPPKSKQPSVTVEKQLTDADTSKHVKSSSKKGGSQKEVPTPSDKALNSPKHVKSPSKKGGSQKEVPTPSDKALNSSVVDETTAKVISEKSSSMQSTAVSSNKDPDKITTQATSTNAASQGSTATVTTEATTTSKTTDVAQVPSDKRTDSTKVSSAITTKPSDVSSTKTSKVSSSKTKDKSKVSSSAKTKDSTKTKNGGKVSSAKSSSAETPTVVAGDKAPETPKAVLNGNVESQQKSVSTPSKKTDQSVPLVNLPIVQPIEKGTTLRMMRRPRGIPRSAQRALNTSNNVQNVLQQMVGGTQRTGVPCGRCDCCQSLLSYVTVLRNFMDHIVSGMAQGAISTEESPVLPPPPCTLCEIQQVAHVDHSPKPNEDSTSAGQINVSTSSQKSNVVSSSGRTPTGPPPSSGGAAQAQQTSYSPAQTQQFPHHGQGGWQHQGQGGTHHYHGGSNANFQNSGGGSQSQNQVHGQQDSGHQQPNASFGSSGNNQSQSQGNNQSTSATNTWSTFTDANAPKTPSQAPSHVTTPQQTGASSVPSQSQRPRRVAEKIAWGAGTQQQQQPAQSAPANSAQQPTAQSPQHHQQQQGSMMNAEAPLTESQTEIHPMGSPSKHHVEQYDESYPEEYDDEDYEDDENEAYVTLATDNQSALLCMVLGNSLLLSGTSKALVVLVTEDVSPHMRYLLSTIYNNVESVDMMESPGTTNLALLEQPDLGISFTKLLIWGIEHFSKGVFLDPNTLVVQNCDDLFEREELSAVPDIGWPDCFNGDVFVYKPSMETFWSLLKCAEDQESFDGGDQGLLNMYFRDWSRNISKKLPFIYNLMANVSYTYRPAFKQFGSQVKIVNFFGSYKPLNVQFHSSTGQMAPDSNVHPTYAQFVYYWLEIFTKRVLPLFSQEVHNLVDSQEYSSAMDILKFFPSNSRKRKESLPMPPSFRVYADANLDRPRRHSSVILGSRDENPEEVGLVMHDKAPSKDDVAAEVEEVPEPPVPQTLPGSEIGNYKDMSAWEHGRMDYLGSHGSDNIMARLDYLTRNPTQKQS